MLSITMTNPAQPLRSWVRPLLAGLGSVAAWSWLPFAFGWFYLALLTLSTSLLIVTIGLLLDSYLVGFRRQRAARLWARAFALVISIGLTLTLVEIVFAVLADSEWAASGHEQNITMPKDWEKRAIVVPGAQIAFEWHGIVHVRNRDQMRRTTPYPPNKDDVFRIIVVGDSNTYGMGIEAENTYPSIIERELASTHRIEVFNLGVSGAQSQDIADITSRFLAELDPDLVIYGVCLNDFLPSGQGVYQYRIPSLPLPRKARQKFVSETRVGALVQQGWEDGLIKIGACNDFYDDVLTDFDQRQQRFAHDVEAMNNEVMSHGLPPVITMVLSARPSLNTREYQIARVAEEHLVAAGMTVIPCRDYFERFDGRQLIVSRWEHHPGVEAHRIYAALFLEVVRQIPGLEEYAEMPQKGDIVEAHGG